MTEEKTPREKLDLSVFAPRSNFSIPNLISLIRIALIPLMIWLYLQNRIWEAVAVVGISGISDAVDGYIARHYHQITPLGKVLDPIADKLTQIGLGACLITHFPYIIPLVVLLVIKEALMLLWGLQLIKAGQPPFSARWWGKVATIGFYAGILAIMAFGPRLGTRGVTVISVIIFVMMFYSLLRYGAVFRRMIRSAGQKEETA